MGIENIFIFGILVIPSSIGLSIVIATIYYNKNYYLETKIRYLKEKNKFNK